MSISRRHFLEASGLSVAAAISRESLSQCAATATRLESGLAVEPKTDGSSALRPAAGVVMQFDPITIGELVYSLYQAYQAASDPSPDPKQMLQEIQAAIGQIQQTLNTLNSKLDSVIAELQALPQKIQGIVDAGFLAYAFGQAQGFLGNIANYTLSPPILAANQNQLQTACDGLSVQLTYILQKASGFSDFVTLVPFLIGYGRGWNALYRVKPGLPSLWDTALHKTAMARLKQVFDANTQVSGEVQDDIKAMPAEFHVQRFEKGVFVSAGAFPNHCYPGDSQVQAYLAGRFLVWWADQGGQDDLAALRWRERACPIPGVTGDYVWVDGWRFSSTADGLPWPNADVIQAASAAFHGIAQRRRFDLAYLKFISDAPKWQSEIEACDTKPGSLPSMFSSKLIQKWALDSAANRVRMVNRDQDLVEVQVKRGSKLPSCDASGTVETRSLLRGEGWDVLTSGVSVCYRHRRIQRREQGPWSPWQHAPEVSPTPILVGLH